VPKKTLAGVTENRPLRLCSSYVWDHPSSGKNQGKLRANEPQLTPAQAYERKREFRVHRFVADNQADVSCRQHFLPFLTTTNRLCRPRYFHLAQSLPRNTAESGSGNDVMWLALTVPSNFTTLQPHSAHTTSCYNSCQKHSTLDTIQSMGLQLRNRIAPLPACSLASQRAHSYRL